ncbi:MAG TPA: flagellar protein [Peptococcaceae bacterium]|nr:flagellar protein [Peptococcaceae bacterium]
MVERISGPGAPGPITTPASPRPAQGPSFREVLERVREEELKISAHAQRRLAERQITLGPDDLARLQRAVTLAGAKGGRSSLLIYGNLALVASVPHRTVVTAVTGEGLVERVFTNIDSAVIVPAPEK